MPYTSSTGDRKGATTRDKTPAKKRQRRNPAAQAVYDRAYDLVREVWLIERWKSSITSKVPTYLSTLVFGRKIGAAPNGVPQRIVLLIQRCVAQACLEGGVTDLNVQTAGWYDQAVVAARAEMSGS